MQRQELSKTLYEIQKGKCFICEEPIDLVRDKWEIDHIIPRSKGGKDDENNYGLTHEPCNRNKSDADLRIARLMSKYEKIKEKTKNKGPNRPNLEDFLEEFNGAKYPITIKNLRNDFLEYSLEEIKGSQVFSVPVYYDKLSGLKYCFVLLPIEYIYHDERINPRGISPRIRGLIDDFFSKHPQLHVSLAWTKIEDHKTTVHIFDGQHKVAAQILLGVREIPVRIFINPDFELLLETNTRAGTVLRQIAFDKSVQRYLGSQIYWEKIDEFKKATNKSEDDLNFSEHDLIHFFKGQHREIKRYILDDIRASVSHSSENKLKDYIEFGGKAKEKPLSYSTAEKTFYSFFIHKEPMGIPLNFKIDIGENPRQLEKDQLIKLLNIFAEEIFIGKYDFDRGTFRVEESLRKGEEISDDHLRAVRIAREEIMYNLMRYIRDSVKRFYLMQGQTIEDDELFQQKFPDILWSNVRKVIKGISNLPIWVNKDATVSSAVFGGKQNYDYWKTIFDSGLTPSGQQVLVKPLNLDDLLK